MRIYIYVLSFMLFSCLGCHNKQQHNAGNVTVKTANETLTGTVTDYDGNIYKTIRIGNQTWMAANLRVIHYNNGDAIKNVIDDKSWRNCKTDAWCSYNNTTAHDSTYGLLYNWHCLMDARKLAPRGWHIPTDAEWQTLIRHLGGEAVAGSKLKAIGAGSVAVGNITATNESKFEALPAGTRNNNGVFDNRGFLGSWWTATSEQDADFAINYVITNQKMAIKQNIDDRVFGLSVRCVKD